MVTRHEGCICVCVLLDVRLIIPRRCTQKDLDCDVIFFVFLRKDAGWIANRDVLEMAYAGAEPIVVLAESAALEGAALVG